MSPDDLAVVERSWDELRRGRGALVQHLAGSYGIVTPTSDAEARAGWLCDAVADSSGCLSAPSQLELRARQLADTWPDPGSAPSFRVDGVGSMQGAGVVCPTSTARSERAWRRAWLLLSDVLAEESLSPFACPSHDGAPTEPPRATVRRYRVAKYVVAPDALTAAMAHALPHAPAPCGAVPSSPAICGPETHGAATRDDITGRADDMSYTRWASIWGRPTRPPQCGEMARPRWWHWAHTAT